MPFESVAAVRGSVVGGLPKRIRTLVFVLLLLPMSFAHAKDPAGNAGNGFDNNGESGVPAGAHKPGKKERDDKEYKKENPDPNKRKYYEQGGKSTNTDDKCRALLAYKAARYEGPQNDYDAKGKPKPGGGKYGDMPTKPEDIIKNIYKFVEDLLYPRQGSDAPFYKDSTLCEKITNGELDIGSPYQPEGEGFACIVAAHFFTSLVRELGFPAREKNVIPSKGDAEWGGQTAAANVWFGGKWNFFDPWESFTDPKDYLVGTGHGATTPGTYHDAYIWAREEAPSVTGVEWSLDWHFFAGAPTDTGWGTKPVIKVTTDGNKIKVETAFLHLGVEDGEGSYVGAPREEESELLANAIYVPHDELVLGTKLGTPGPETTGYELVTLLVPPGAPKGTQSYTAILHNPTAEPQPYALELKPLPIRVALSMTPAGILTGTLAPGAMKRIPFEITIGDSLLLPPPAVVDVVSTPLVDGQVAVSWSAVPGASSYRIYRSAQIVESLRDEAAQLVTETTDIRVKLEATEGDLLWVEAVGVQHLASELDLEGGSSTVAATEANEKAPGMPRWLPVLAVIIVLALLVTWYRHKRRIEDAPSS